MWKGRQACVYVLVGGNLVLNISLSLCNIPFKMFKITGRTGIECNYQLLNYADDDTGQIK
jgi:hypothetical protein